MTEWRGRDVDPFTMVDAAVKGGWSSRAELREIIAAGLGEWGGKPRSYHNAGVNSDGSVDRGVWQINDGAHNGKSWYDINKIFDPYENARMARQVYLERGGGEDGMRAWYGHTSKNGAYGDRAARYYATADKYIAEYFANGGQAFQGDPAEGRVNRTLTRESARDRLQEGMLEMSRMIKEQAGGTEALQAERIGATGQQTLDESVLTGTQAAAGDDDAILQELQAFTENRKIIAQPGALPADPATVVPTEDGGAYQMPSVSAADIERWTATGLRSNAARGAAVARALGFNGSIGGVGARGNASDHPHGNAIDLMTNDDTETGLRLAEFFVANAEALGATYVIFDGRIASASRDWEWRTYSHPAGRTDNTAMHRDHPHVSFR